MLKKIMEFLNVGVVLYPHPRRMFTMDVPTLLKSDFTFWNHKSKTFKKNKRRGL